MTPPKKDELELTMLLFAALAPLGYWTLSFVFSLIG